MIVIYYSIAFSYSNKGQIVVDKTEPEAWKALRKIEGYKMWYTEYEMRKLREKGFMFVSTDRRGRKTQWHR